MSGKQILITIEKDGEK